MSRVIETEESKAWWRELAEVSAGESWCCRLVKEGDLGGALKENGVLPMRYMVDFCPMCGKVLLKDEYAISAAKKKEAVSAENHWDQGNSAGRTAADSRWCCYYLKDWVGLEGLQYQDEKGNIQQLIVRYCMCCGGRLDEIQNGGKKKKCNCENCTCKKGTR